MSSDQKAIWDLCDVLEAELDGRPYDRKAALELAAHLGNRFPGIHQTMKQIHSRINAEHSVAA